MSRIGAVAKGSGRSSGRRGGGKRGGRGGEAGSGRRHHGDTEGRAAELLPVMKKGEGMSQIEKSCYHKDKKKERGRKKNRIAASRAIVTSLSTTPPQCLCNGGQKLKCARKK